MRTTPTMTAMICRLGFVLFIATVTAEEPKVAVQRRDAWTNLFAGKSARLTCEVIAKQDGGATLQWSVAVAGAVIARGEQAVDFQADETKGVSWDVELPELRAGVVAEASLEIGLRARDGSPPFEAVPVRVPLLVSSPEVTAQRAEWLKSCELVLFDPAGKTADAFARSRIPHRVAEEPQCAHLSPGLIVYGEGIDEERLEAVWRAAVEAAVSGRRVLVLSSPRAAVPVERLMTPQEDAVESIRLRRSDIITLWDKRWDAIEWPAPGRLVASSLHWTARGDVPLVEFRNDRDGWHWLDVRHRNGGRLMWSGWGIVESWEATPMARLVLVKMLEELSLDRHLKEGLKHDEK